LLRPTTPVKPFPVEQNCPDDINGKKLESYIDWISPTFLITLVSVPAASTPARLTHDGLPVGIQGFGAGHGTGWLTPQCTANRSPQPIP
jgi:amidase